MTKKFLILIAAAVLLVVIISCSKESGNQNAPSTQAAALKNTPAGSSQPIQFTAYDIDGKEHSSSEWLGKEPVIVNFWGTWCPPCRREIPDLVKLYAEYHPKGIQILGLAVKDSPSGVRAFAQREGMDWVMMMADGDNASVLKATEFVPTTIFFDKNGNEVARVVGQQSYDQFKQLFEKIL